MSTDVALVTTALLAAPVRLDTAHLTPREGGMPSEPGFYAWWCSKGALPMVPWTTHPTDGNWGLLYVGIAPVRALSSQDLRARVVRNHIGGNTGSSTFRLSLASLLFEALDLHPAARRTRVVLSKADNARLRAWQFEHLALTWAPAAEPWHLENAVIAELEPPLNLAGNTAHLFHAEMTARRAAFRAAAWGSRQ